MHRFRIPFAAILVVHGLTLTARPDTTAAAAPAVLRLRARVTEMTPSQPARIAWRYGGEGLGGRPTTGELTAVLELPPAPGQGLDTRPAGTAALEEMVAAAAKEGPPDRIVVTGEAADYHYLMPGIWSPAVPITDFGRGGRRFLTFTLNGHQTGNAITGAVLEFELLRGDASLKRFSVAGPDGPTFGVVIPFHHLDRDGGVTDAFLDELGGLLDYARARERHLASMPWGDRPTPRLYAMITDCSGYGAGSGYGIRTADKQVMFAEFRTLRRMGINGLRGGAHILRREFCHDTELLEGMSRAGAVHTVGYPISMVAYPDGRMPRRAPGDGCPYHPDNRAGLADRVTNAVDALREHARRGQVDTLWALTVDEIGTVFDGAPERRAHMGACPYCRDGFREMIRADGRTPEDFGVTDWEPIRPTWGYWTINFWESQRILEAELEAANRRMQEGAQQARTAVGGAVDGADALIGELLGDVLETARPPSAVELLAAVRTAQTRLDDLLWRSRVLEVPADQRQEMVSPRGRHLLEYYTRRFNNLASAMLFEPLQQAVAAENERKRAALARGDGSDPAATQSWLLTYALRGNTFLMGGHSLDFFDFYRFADNGFVYETSNRDHRVWPWDSYLCDVGRSLNRYYGKEFGVYVKPHRGAPIQRALTAVARGVRMIFWYTYGPEWHKGDSFSGNQALLEQVGWFARLLADAEAVTYDSEPAETPRIAVVRPRTAEFFSGNASWENGKWVYMALTHAHLPVTPLDETLLLESDLSGFQVIVVSGSHIRRDVAERLRDWVLAGGTLVTSGWGMAMDEAGEPLETLWPLFGVAARNAVQTWGTVPRYGATRLGAIRPTGEPPDGAVFKTGAAAAAASFVPAVGREVIEPLDGTEVLARYADGGAAVTRRRHGAGAAVLIGIYAGLEYAADPMANQPYDALKRAVIVQPVLDAGIQPLATASDPQVETALLRNRESGRQALILINWRHHIEEPVTVTLPNGPPPRTVRSLALQSELKMSAMADGWQVTVPRMDQGDILLIE